MLPCVVGHDQNGNRKKFDNVGEYIDKSESIKNSLLCRPIIQPIYSLIWNILSNTNIKYMAKSFCIAGFIPLLTDNITYTKPQYKMY